MKKVGLILVCTLIMAVFIALNYLLWERERNLNYIETLSSSNSSKNTSIDTLGEKITKLDETKKQLESKVEKLEEEKRIAELNLRRALDDKAEFEKEQVQKSETLEKLKQMTDLKPLEATIKKWVESIDKGLYEEAFELDLKKAIVRDSNANVADYGTAFKNSVKSMKLKTIKAETGESKSGKIGNITFYVSLDVKRVENSNSTAYADGLNERYFTLVFSKEKSKWLISDISSTF